MADDLAPYLEQLRSLPFVKKLKLLSVSQAKGPGRVLRIETPSGSNDFEIRQFRSHLSRATAEGLRALALQVSRQQPPLLLLVPQVGRELGEELAAAGLQYVDQAGNCYVRVGDDYLAKVQGQRVASVAVVDKELRAPAYRVLFALLVDPELLRGPVRALAQASGGVSPQTASDVRERLIQRGMAVSTSKSVRWTPQGQRSALELWIAGHATKLFPSLLIGRYRAREVEIKALEARLAPILDKHGAWRWGGAAAASRLTGYYRGSQTLVYLQHASDDIARKLSLVPDANGSVALAASPGPLAFKGPEPTSVHPLLAYADLLQEGSERAREAARVLAEEHLATFLGTA